MINQRFVIMNTKKKMTLSQASNWYGDMGQEHTLIHAIRHSTRGKREDIYILGASGSYGVHKGSNIAYIADTGNGHGGNGRLIIKSVNTAQNGIIMQTDNIMEINENIKLPIWVIK